MTIFALILILVLIGGCAWLINYLIPMPGWMKMLINVVLATIAVLVVLSAFGVLDEIRGTRVPRL